jgi:phosphate/sulfate permease
MDGSDQHQQDQQRPWGERLADEGAAARDQHSVKRLLGDAIGVVRERIGEVSRNGVGPLLEEAAGQIRPATREELLARYPGLDDDEIARRLITRASRTAAGVALGIGAMLAAQEAMAVVSAGGTLGTLGISAIAEVLMLFILEAKLRADLAALAGQPVRTPKELVGAVVGEVAAAGGWRSLRGRSLRRAFPEMAARRVATRIVSLVPRRFARIIAPEIVAPLVGAAFAARLAARQLREAGERCWAETPRTTITWGTPVPSSGNGSAPPRA